MGLKYALRSFSHLAKILSCRKEEPKAAALSDLGFHARLPSHPLGGAANNSEADACAFIFLIRVQAMEHEEHSILGFGRYANAVVGKPDFHLRIGSFTPN